MLIFSNYNITVLACGDSTRVVLRPLRDADGKVSVEDEQFRRSRLIGEGEKQIHVFQVKKKKFFFLFILFLVNCNLI